jgi:hypothetical protein
MALSQKNKLKKTAKKQAKRKLALKKKNQSAFTDALKNMALYAKNAPLHSCVMANSVWHSGMGHLMISRDLKSGEIAVVVFLLDVYCLGVKDCFSTIQWPQGYQEFIDKLNYNEDGFHDVELAYAKSLLNSVIEYARQFKLEPHKDVYKLLPFLGNIETGNYEFEFGQEGKPLYIPGPNETQGDIRNIMKKLEKYAGQGNYNYIMQFHEEISEF